MLDEIEIPFHEAGELIFAKKCDEFGCEYLHIRQEAGGEYSNKMRQTGQKRPDFLVNIPNLGSLLVDVKIREAKPAGVTNPILMNQSSYGIEYQDFLKMRELEKNLHICVWYAFVDHTKMIDNIKWPSLLVPLSRVEANMPDHVKEKIKNEEDQFWIVRIPFECMNIWNETIDLGDKCHHCKLGFCKINEK